MNEPTIRIIEDDTACPVDEHQCATVIHQRRMMAAEVHDSIAQTLTFVKMRLPLLEDALQAHDEASAHRYLADIRDAVGEAHTSLREIVTHLRAPADPRGLAPALLGLAERFRERSGVALQVANAMPSLSLGPERESELFHIVQEALANIEHHAAARHAWLRIDPLPAGGVRVCIDDDGVGPRPPASDGRAHHGLSIMDERAHRLGGALQVAARPGGGTRVRLIVPASTAPRGAMQ
ncbi:sensor histidine kinase [Ideonella sp.]|uniref:sensor histidine kinase n=1 Tax=Ideonella sp. TaxID=1929293 RepID=UPI002B45F4A4|nr:ATP-binding protein [Ideonella sp.]HJV68392.1 ATP-binding protein [Ideonella sp.]